MTTAHLTKDQLLELVTQQQERIDALENQVRYDWLGQYLFSSLSAVQEHATRWLWLYNHERPNMGLGGITPQQKLALAN